MHVIAAKAVCFKEASEDSFVEYQTQVVKNAKTLAGALIDRGFKVISGGTDNHLILVDMRSKNLTGKAAEEVLGKVGITVNKNAIPFDPESPNVTSGIRIGTPSLTTRGMKEAEMEKIAGIIGEAIDAREDQARLDKAAATVKEMCREFPLYRD